MAKEITEPIPMLFHFRIEEDGLPVVTDDGVELPMFVSGQVHVRYEPEEHEMPGLIDYMRGVLANASGIKPDQLTSITQAEYDDAVKKEE